MLNRLGNVEKAFLIGDYAEGKDTGIIDLLLVGDIDSYHLNDLTKKTERYIHRKIRTLVFKKDELESFAGEFSNRPQMLIWSK